MKYLIFATKTDAEDRNHQEAAGRGCSGTTQYWWATIYHDDGRAAMQIPDEDVIGLTTDEQASLVSLSIMDEDGWFPVPEAQ